MGRTTGKIRLRGRENRGGIHDETADLPLHLLLDTKCTVFRDTRVYRKNMAGTNIIQARGSVVELFFRCDATELDAQTRKGKENAYCRRRVTVNINMLGHCFFRGVSFRLQWRFYLEVLKLPLVCYKFFLSQPAVILDAKSL